MHHTMGDISIDKVFDTDFQNIVFISKVSFYEFQSIILDDLSLFLDIQLELKNKRAVDFKDVLINNLTYLKNNGLSTLCIAIILFCFSMVDSVLRWHLEAVSSFFHEVLSNALSHSSLKVETINFTLVSKTILILVNKLNLFVEVVLYEFHRKEFINKFSQRIIL